MTQQKITVRAHIKAPIDKIWHSYTDAEEMMIWNSASDDWHAPRATVDLREGGQFSCRMEARDGSQGFDFAGTYTKIEPNSLIEYEFGDRHAKVEFTPTQTGVDVSITFDPETTFPLEMQQQGWQAILDNFKSHLEAA